MCLVKERKRKEKERKEIEKTKKERKRPRPNMVHCVNRGLGPTTSPEGAKAGNACHPSPRRRRASLPSGGGVSVAPTPERACNDPLPPVTSRFAGGTGIADRGLIIVGVVTITSRPPRRTGHPQPGVGFTGPGG